MAKQLISLISTEGKTMEQVQEEAVLAMEKFRQVHKQSLAKNSKIQQPVQPQPTPTIDEINKQAENEGKLAPPPTDGIQVVIFRKTPIYPKKK